MKKYLPFDSASGYPAQEDLFYECQTCGGEVASLTVSEKVSEKEAQCACGNIQIDVDAGRISVKNPDSVKLFSLK